MPHISEFKTSEMCPLLLILLGP